MDLPGPPPGARRKLPDALPRRLCSKLSSETFNDVFPHCNHTYRGVDGPALDEIIFTKIRVNEVTTPAAEKRGRGNVYSITCVEYTPKEVEETSLLHEAS